jgi:hypothetical protein
MSKLSSRDIQMFVAGAFAVAGFLDFYWLPYYIFAKPNTYESFSHGVAALALPLGIGIFLDSARAMLLTQIYLWLEVIAACVAILLVRFMPTPSPLHLSWRNGSDMIIKMVLLGLIIWSRSNRFRHEPDA